jgi:hypothetical protein
MNDEVSAESGRYTAVRPVRAGGVLNEHNGLMRYDLFTAVSIAIQPMNLCVAGSFVLSVSLPKVSLPKVEIQTEVG